MSSATNHVTQAQPEPAGAIRPVLAVVGHSGSGKTNLLERILPVLAEAGLRVSLIKHAHQGFDMDRPGKDSYRLRAAGARQVMVASAQHWALLADTPGQDEPDLGALLAQLDQSTVDLILLEGFKHAALPKLEVFRPAIGKAPLYPDDPQIIAVATNAPASVRRRDTLDLNDTTEVADFIRSRMLDHGKINGGL